MNPVWHPLWLALETVVWFLTLALLILGTYTLGMRLGRRWPGRRRGPRLTP